MMCSPIRAKLVGHQLSRHLTLMLQCLTKEAFGRLTVSALRCQNIDNITILIHCPPQVVAFASDRDKSFIDVPDVSEPSLFPAQRPSIGRPKLETPISNGLVRDGDTTLSKQFFYIAKAEAEPMVEPDGMADNFRGKTMTFISRFHPFIVAEVGIT